MSEYTKFFKVGIIDQKLNDKLRAEQGLPQQTYANVCSEIRECNMRPAGVVPLPSGNKNDCKLLPFLTSL